MRDFTALADQAKAQVDAAGRPIVLEAAAK